MENVENGAADASRVPVSPRSPRSPCRAHFRGRRVPI
jgi:hypothetical protein